MLLRVLTAVAALVLGAGAGLAATLVHARWWGFALGLGAAAATTLALPAGARRLAFMLGWIAAIGYLMWPRAEGDYVIASSPAGYGLLAVSFVLFLVALATSSRGHSRRGSREDPVVSGP